MLRNLLKHFSTNRAVTLLILAGTVVWSLTMVKSGILYDYGLGFWGPNGHDGVWHLSLAGSLSRGSIQMPVFAGEALQNYHLGFDLLLAGLYRITGIPLALWYFQIIPVFTALSIGVLTYVFVLSWKKNKSAAFWSTFLVYFAGNLGWVVNIFKTGSLGGESIFWAQPAVLTLINPPFALSLVFILAGLYFVTKSRVILAAICFGVLIQIKAYAGVIVLGALLVSAVYEFLSRRTFVFSRISLVSLLISLIIFLPFLSSSSLLELKPFWFLETMMAFPDRFGWAQFGEAMVNYRLAGNFIKSLAAYSLAFVIFWYGNMGVRFLGEFYVASFAKNKRKPSVLDVLLISAILIGTLMAMLFVQKGTAWNTIQFYYYSLFFASLLSGIVFAGILKNFSSRKLGSLVALGMIVFCIPTTISVLKHYLPARPPAMISVNELAALNFLKNQQDGVVLVMPFDRKAAQDAVSKPPRPLYLYESTAYVSAFSGKPVWLEDEVNLDITGYDWPARRTELTLALESSSSFSAFVESNNISYVYVAQDQAEKYKNVLGGLNKIYSAESEIYKID